jgi:TolB protein
MSARNDDGRLTVGCYLYDVALEQQLVREGWVVAPADWRRAAHKCADLIYSRLSGESPFFDSRIAYIAETGPKDNRVKRLAIMDSRRGQPPLHHQWPVHRADPALFARLFEDRSTCPTSTAIRASMSMTSARAADAGDRKPATPPSPRAGRPMALHPLFDGGGGQYRHLPRARDRRHERKLTDTRHRRGRILFARWQPRSCSKATVGQPAVLHHECRRLEPARISFFGGRCATPEWSPRGDQIAFTHIAGDFNVAVMNTSGGNMRT